MKHIIILLTLFVLSACGSKTGTGPQYDLKGYDVESVGGGGQLASYKDGEGFPLATGTVLNGVRNGTWVTYHPGSDKIKTITNYINGKKNGMLLTLNDRTQMESLVHYKNDQLHGMKTNYRFGRVLDETSYKDGQIDGPYAIYNEGVIQKRGEMKAGKQHGKLQFFDEKGNMTMEYVYKNGEKVSGGIVTPKPAETE